MNLWRDIGSHLSGLEQLRVVAEKGLRPAFGDLLDMRLLEVERGRVLLEAPVGEHLNNAHGTVHGGFASAFLDFACGWAVISSLAPGQGTSTIELKVAYHKAITPQTGRMRAEGRVMTIGRRIAFTEAKLTDQTGKLYASATSTLIVTAAA